MPELSLDFLFQEGLSVQQIEDSIRNGEFTLNDEDFTRLGRLSLDAQTPSPLGGERVPLSGVQLPPGLSKEETNRLIDEAASISRKKIFQSGESTENIRAAQSKLRQEVQLTKDKAKGEPGFWRNLVLGEGSEIGDTGFRVNIPLLMVGIGIATGGFAVGAGAGIAADVAFAGGVASRIPGVATALGAAGRAFAKTPIVPQVTRAIGRRPVRTGLAALGGIQIGGMFLADQDSPVTITPPAPTNEADIAASEKALEEALAQQDVDPQEGDAPLLPRFEEVDTPFGPAVVTMMPNEFGQFLPIEVTFLEEQERKREQESVLAEATRQKEQTQNALEQLKIASFLADPGNRLRLQATQALAAGIGPDVLGGQEGGIGPGVLPQNRIAGRPVGMIGQLLGLDPQQDTPIAQTVNEPFGALPRFSEIQGLSSSRLSELDALLSVGFGQDPEAIKQLSLRSRLPGTGRRPIATFGR